MKAFIDKKDAIIIAIIVAFSCLLYNNPPFFNWTDINVWKSDYFSIKRCIAEKQVPCNQASFFSSGYLLNSSILSRMASTATTIKSFKITYINYLFLLLPLLCFANFSREHFFRKAITYSACVLASGISGFYVYSGALELQAGITWGIFLVCFFFGERAKNPKLNTAMWVISLYFFVLYKDTNIAVAFGTFLCTLLYYLIVPTQGVNLKHQFKSKLLIFMGTLTLGAATSISYNYYRYASLFPISYKKIAEEASPSAEKSIEFFIASIFSPNGGFAVFWAFPIALAFWSTHKKLNTVARDCLVIGLFAALIAASGLSLWWAPFGWDSFGNRLIIPLGLGLIILLIGTGGIEPRPQSSAFPKPSSFVKITALALVIISFAYTITAHTKNKSDLWNDSLHNGPRCQAMLTALRSEVYTKLKTRFWKSDYYYDCATERFSYVPGVTEYSRSKKTTD